MSYLLDTNAISALMKGDARVLARLRAVGRAEVAIPQPVLAELVYGLERLPESRRKTRLRRRLGWILDEVVRASWTDEVSERFGAIKALLERRGDRIEDFDVALAAHALAAGAILVTADARHLPRVPGIEVEDWTGTQAQ